jgi:hypothetical protein
VRLRVSGLGRSSGEATQLQRPGKQLPVCLMNDGTFVPMGSCWFIDEANHASRDGPEAGHDRRGKLINADAAVVECRVAASLDTLQVISATVHRRPQSRIFAAHKRAEEFAEERQLRGNYYCILPHGQTPTVDGPGRDHSSGCWVATHTDEHWHSWHHTDARAVVFTSVIEESLKSPLDSGAILSAMFDRAQALDLA